MSRLHLPTVLLILWLVPVACGPAAQEDPHAPWSANAPNWGPRHEIQDLRITECSGVVASRQHPGVWWIHNDSGDEARIFSMNELGQVLSMIRITGASNVDWEDLAIDAENRLYICDMGNNYSFRQDLKIYVIDEPDPTGQSRAPVLRTLRVRYPEQESFPDPEMRFDCEANFVHDETLYVITKHATAGHSDLYRVVDMQDESEQVLELVDSFNTGSQVTSADLSPDGRELAVLSYEYLHLYAVPADAPLKLSNQAAVRIPFEARQCECITHEDQVLRVINEQREIHLFSREAIHAAGEWSSPEEPLHFESRPEAPEVLRRGYLPPRDSIELPEAELVLLPLQKGFGEKRAALPAAPDTASVMLQRNGSSLRVGLRWTPMDGGNDDGILAWISWGPASDRMLCGPEDHALRLIYEDRGLPALIPEPIAPNSTIPAHSLRQSNGYIEGWIELPDAAGGSGERALSVVLLSPSGADWYFGGDSSMFAWRNPALWGVLR